MNMHTWRVPVTIILCLSRMYRLLRYMVLSPATSDVTA
ncbi:MAG: hypothetical protein A4E40_00366 [Methanoregulaceae archaeon PtaU1.Bin059]|nr:MAG: hypothetical protein A4E40_00366 [Methanoregulaceae archaeon PtaU1.Bin059]